MNQCSILFQVIVLASHLCFARVIELIAHPKINIILSFSWRISSKFAFVHTLNFICTPWVPFLAKSMFQVSNQSNISWGTKALTWKKCELWKVFHREIYSLSLCFLANQRRWWWFSQLMINTLRQKQNGCHLAGSLFIFFRGNCFISKLTEIYS